MSGRDFLSTGDWTIPEFHDFLDEAAGMKRGQATGRLEGRTLGLVFFDPSLRTRVSFEVGMQQLGGHVVNLDVGQGVWQIETREGVVMDGACSEHLREAAGVLSRYVDLLGVRAFPKGLDWRTDRSDPVVRGFAQHSSVGVVNLESALWHPCQALADALTWRELGLRQGDPVVLTWTYHPKALPMAVPNSVVLAAAQYGLDLTILRPDEFALDQELTARAVALALETKGRVRESSDLSALEGARVVYAKSWGSLQAYGQHEAEGALRGRYRDWQVTEQWLQRTDAARLMHCLPVRRNVVVSDAVLDSRASVVLQQAENRLHVQKALLLKMLGGES